MQPYVDYRLVPNSTDEAAVLTDLQLVSPKFKLDGVAVAATFDIEIDSDPKAAILAVSKKFNISVRRLQWGYRADRLQDAQIQRPRCEWHCDPNDFNADLDCRYECANADWEQIAGVKEVSEVA